MIRYGLSASSTCGKSNVSRVVLLTHRRWKSHRLHPADSHNTPTKRFPIFPLRKILSVRVRVRWERAARTVTTPNNFPWSYFQQQETSNWLSTYPSFNLPPPRPRCRPLPCPFLFPSVRSLSSSLHVSFDSFRSSSYFSICPRRPWTISALLRFRISYPFATIPAHVSAIHAVLFSRRMKSAKGHREYDERADVRMCRSRNHLIAL